MKQETYSETRARLTAAFRRNPSILACSDGFCGDLEYCNTCRRIAGLSQHKRPDTSLEDWEERNSR